MKAIQRKNYSEEFRRKVLAAYYGSQETVLMVARRFGVKQDTVSSWVHRDHRSENQKKSSTFASSKRKSMNKTEGKQDVIDSRLKSLEAELEHERMRSIALEKMIDVAERELGVAIRKKFGAKQFKK
jgi:transposase-like protein